ATSSGWFPTSGSKPIHPSPRRNTHATRTRNISRVACKRREHFWRKRSVPAHCSYDYAVIRVVPRVERQEFINAGVIVWCSEKDVLEARIELNEARARALDPALDVDAVRK